MTIINLVTPKAGAKRELLFNKQATGQDEHLEWSTLFKTRQEQTF